MSLELLKQYIERNGPIKAFRVSSAGGSKWHASMYGIAHYEICIAKAGHVTAKCTQRARPLNPSNSAMREVLRVKCESEVALPIFYQGKLWEEEAERIIDWLAQRMLENYAEARGV